MRIFLIIPFLFMASKSWALTHVSCVDGIIVFEVACGSCTPITPSFYELALATTSAALPGNFGRFKNYEEFSILLTSKSAIEEKFIEHQKTLLAYEGAYADYPTVNLQLRIKKMNAIVNLLYALYFSLP